MSTKHLVSLFLVCSQLLVVTSAAADVLRRDDPHNPSFTYYEVVGHIAPGDDFDFGDSSTQPLVILDSRGGDLATAMKLGRQMRSANARAIVRVGEYCVSACVFMLAGAVERYVEGQVGIHRPYPSHTGNETRAQAQHEFDQIRSQSRQYLHAMNMPPSLVEAMLSVPSEQVRYLDPSQLEAFGLSGIDPVYQYQQDSEAAAYYRITRGELLNRKQVANTRCAPLATADDAIAYIDCNEATMWGIPVAEFKRRESLVRQACAPASSGREKTYMQCRSEIMGSPYRIFSVAPQKPKHYMTLKDLGL